MTILDIISGTDGRSERPPAPHLDHADRGRAALADTHSTSYVYVVTNTVNGKQYVGQTTYSLERRWRAHVHDAKTQKTVVPVFIHALRKYGSDVFAMRALRALPAGTTKAARDAIEASLIVELGTLVPNGYNLRTGGSHGRLHADTKAKISVGNKGKRRTPEARERYRQVRLNETPEVRRYRLAKQKGRSAQPGVVERMNLARLRSGKWFHSDEIKRKISAALKGRKPHPNNAAALRKAHLGAKRSPETCARISAAIRAAYEGRRKATVVIDGVYCYGECSSCKTPVHSSKKTGLCIACYCEARAVAKRTA